ncbi:hypothetical protein EV182_006152, partial [Spiromyces aspiralis]
MTSSSSDTFGLLGANSAAPAPTTASPLDKVEYNPSLSTSSFVDPTTAILHDANSSVGGDSETHFSTHHHYQHQHQQNHLRPLLNHDLDYVSSPSHYYHHQQHIHRHHHVPTQQHQNQHHSSLYAAAAAAAMP